MIKLATVFSGIGAIEHALDRMQLEHEIVFACDNGDVELEMPKVRIDVDSMERELEILKKTIKKVCKKIHDEESVDYATQLDVMVAGVENEYKKLIEKLNLTEDNSAIVETLMSEVGVDIASAIQNTTASKRKKYQELNSILESKPSSIEAKLFFLLRLALTLDEDDFVSSTKELEVIYAQYKSAKRIVKSGRDISERLEMLHDKLFYLETNNDLRQLESYEEKKAYVDKLYAGKESQNKVKQSYMANYKLSEENFHWNVAFLDGKQYAGQVDLFVGGSPCQSFSLVGKQRGLEDTRGTLFYEYARLVKEIQPKVSMSYSEKEWQRRIYEIICVLYPKYIARFREIEVGTDGRHMKTPDFMLVDSAGFVDILEIKKPDGIKVVSTTEYRNNYVASRDLEGAIVQIEKYIYILNHEGEARVKKIQDKVRNHLPSNFRLKVVNPQWILLLGRSNNLTDEQLFDFEIIKRQHKNIVDIMTYDDLLKRFRNILNQIKNIR